MEWELPRLAWLQLWQVTIVAFVVAILVRLFARNRPYLAHALYCVILLKCLTPPLWSSPSGVFSWVMLTTDAPSTSLDEVDRQTTATPALEVGPRPLVDVDDFSRFAPRHTEQTGKQSAAIPTNPDEAASPPHDEGSHGTTVSDRDKQTKAPNARTRGPSPAVSSADEFTTLTRNSNASASGNASRLWQRILIVGWGLGTLALLLWWAVVWWRCVRVLRKHGVPFSPADRRLFESVRRELRIRRKVRLVAIDTSWGPAVLGTLRPTVVIPLTFLRSKQADQLRMVFAHEFLHVRRGDTWIQAGQLLVQAVWWFHPLVWFVNRRLTRETERCCDEQVVAELGCTRSSYAHVLLDVLEWKHKLRPLPVCPGVKAVEITHERLERIMRLEQGCRKRTPWTCLLLALLAASLLLPGAGLEAGRKRRAKKQRQTQQRRQQPAEAPPKGVTQAADEQQQPLATSERSHRVHDVIRKLQDELLCEREEARRLVLMHIEADVGPMLKSNKATEAPAADTAILPAPPLQTANPQRGPRPSQTSERWSHLWQGKTLRIRGDQTIQRRVADVLHQLRSRPLPQMRIETVIATTSPDFPLFDSGAWQAAASGQDPASLTMAPSQDREKKFTQAVWSEHSRLSQSTERELPVVYRVCDAEQTAKLKEALQQDARSNLLCSPSVVTWSGRTATMYTGSSRPFVVGRTPEGKPKLRVVSEGVQSMLLPIVIGRHRVVLKSSLQVSTIRKVNHFNLPDSQGKSFTVQVPVVAQSEIEFTTCLQLGQTLVVSGDLYQPADLQKPQRLLYFFTVEPLTVKFKSSPQPVQPASATPPEPQPIQSLEDAYRLKNAWHPQIPTESLSSSRNSRSLRDLQQTLNQSVNLQFEQVPLAEILRSVAKTHGVNIVLDARGFEAAGVEEDVRCSLELSDVRLRNGLRLLLEPRGLGFVAEDDVVRVTSHEETLGRIATRTYSVADLVVPIPGFGGAILDFHPDQTTLKQLKLQQKATEVDSQTRLRKANFKPLVQLLQTTIHPDSWEQTGGWGQIGIHEPTLSLVIRQRASIHQEIVELLEQVRRLQDVQVTLETGFIKAEQRLLGEHWNQVTRHGCLVLTVAEVKDWLKAARASKSVAWQTSPKVTLFNGQPITLRMRLEDPNETTELHLHSVASADRRHLRLSLAPNSQTALQTLSLLQQKTLESGGAVIVDLAQFQELSRVLPAGVLAQPFREQLGKTVREHAQSQGPFLYLRPRVIVQEEEELRYPSEKDLQTPARK